MLETWRVNEASELKKITKQGEKPKATVRVQTSKDQLRVYQYRGKYYLKRKRNERNSERKHE